MNVSSHMSSKLIAMREQNARGASRRGSLFASQTLASSSSFNPIYSIHSLFSYLFIFFIFCKSGHSIIFDPFFIFWFYHLLYLLQVRDQHHLQPNLLAGDSWFLELFHLPRRPRPYVVTTFQPFCRPLKVQKAPQRRLLNLMDSFRRLSSRPHCWWWLLLRAVMASLMEAICLSLIRNASQSPQAAQPKHKFTKTKTVAST